MLMTGLRQLVEQHLCLFGFSPPPWAGSSSLASRSPCSTSSITAASRTFPSACRTAASASRSFAPRLLLDGAGDSEPVLQLGLLVIADSSGQWSGTMHCALSGSLV
jgi:hypothetical protein